MPRPNHMQRLRAQLAASQCEVRALREKVDYLEGSRMTSEERAERAQLEQLAALRTCWLDAEHRAGVAELKLLLHTEADKRAAVVADEKQERRHLSAKGFRAEPVKDEGSEHARTGAVDGDPARPIQPGGAAAPPAVCPRVRPVDGLQGAVVTQEEVAAEDIATAHSHSVMSSVDNDDASSAIYSSASEVLFIDHICFWVAAFVPRSWAPVCSKASRFVFRVIHIYRHVWNFVGVPLAHLQSKGKDSATDNRAHGPGFGEIYRAYLKVQRLRDTVLRLREHSTAGNPRFITRWVLHMDFQINMYDTMRLRHRELYLTALSKYKCYSSVLDNIKQALKAFDDRKMAEANKEEDGGEAAESSSSA
eukprot:TRINITY_DN6904_c1_g1_i3.p1 TRINITY_DN6904_c1_g1~~TRINITY_DN6904_c1_g1_i3.p1  ORF type:complete len:393 (+),score=93.46 TRINITY_DN6904_c1_g1_i3:92-1180(+)